MKYPTPNHEGFFWAKLVHPSEMPESEDWKSFDWEIVEVHDNNGSEEDGEKWGVFVGGIGPTQWVQDFIWGPEVIRPKELK